MRRIIVDIYDHTTNDEVEDVLAALRGVGVDARLETVAPRRAEKPTPAQVQAREKVWLAQKVEQPITLSADQADALWQSILNDSICSRAFTGPRF